MRPLLVLVLALPLLGFSPMAQAQGGPEVRIDVLAVTGDPIPGVPFVIYQEFPVPPLVDARGRIVFEAELFGGGGFGGGRAVFETSPSGQVDPGVFQSGTPTGLDPGVSLDDLALEGLADGRILLSAELEGPGVNPDFDDVLLVKEVGGDYTLFTDGVPAGLPPFVAVGEILDARIAPGGNVAFRGELVGLGVNNNNRSALFGPSVPGGEPVMRVRQRVPLDAEPELGLVNIFNEPRVNEMGEIAFHGWTRLARVSTAGLFGPDTSSPLRRLAADETPIPGHPELGDLDLTFRSFPGDTFPVLARRGDVYFYARCGPRGFGGGTGEGIFRHAFDGGVEPRVVACSDSELFPGGPTLAFVASAFAANDAGAVVFTANTASGDQLPFAVWRALADGSYERLATLGEEIPGRPGQIFESAFQVDMNERGDVLFPVRAVDDRRSPVVFAPVDAAAIAPLAKRDLLDTGAGLVEIATIQVAEGGHEGARAFSENGIVAFLVWLEDGRKAIVRVEYPITRDGDGDEIPDWRDNCEGDANPDQADRDGDGTGDACNDAEDVDGDEFADVLDNCPDEPNADQENRDGDGFGDLCDPFPDEPDHEKAQLRLDLAATEAELLVCLDRPAFIDSDGDGIPDRNDACPETTDGAETDAAGCSQVQFCESLGSAERPIHPLVCIRADWRGNEIVSFLPRDCRPASVWNWSNVRCVVDLPDEEGSDRSDPLSAG